MDNLSYTEACVFSALRFLKDPADIESITNLLLGVYACHFIGSFEGTNEDNFINELKSFQEDNIFLPIIDKFNMLGMLEIKKTEDFDRFIINNIVIKNTPHLLFNKLITKKTISLFAKKISSLLKTSKRKHSQYEVRFFWPSHLYPEVYDLNCNIFNKKYYVNKLTTDKYIVTNADYNIKIRKNELQIKNCIQNINNISHFVKKKKIKFPIKMSEIKEFLSQSRISDSRIFKAPEDFLMYFPEFPGSACVEVIKERYVRKLGDHIKIEISLIKIQEKEWKTICIESTRIQNVLALSLLINQEHAEILRYDRFLQKYGTAELKNNVYMQ